MLLVLLLPRPAFNSPPPPAVVSEDGFTPPVCTGAFCATEEVELSVSDFTTAICNDMIYVNTRLGEYIVPLALK